MQSAALFFSAAGGLLPALLWLWFWLREDRLHPEPRRLIALSFIFGAAAVFPAAFLEIRLERVFALSMGVLVIFWSFIEEFLKYIAAGLAGLRRAAYDEPIDAIIYLITAALGFAAMENALFLFPDFLDGEVFQALTVGNMRFIGATLVHILSSGALGFFIALSFYKRRFTAKILRLLLGLAAATAIHAVFNYMLIRAADTGSSNLILGAFSFVWVLVLLLIVGFEKVKRLRKT